MPDAELRGILVARGLRPTRQRIILIGLLLQNDAQPATIKAVIKRAQDNGRRISRSTVRNGLRDFEQFGLTDSRSVQGVRETHFALNPPLGGNRSG
ncbi:transcriptional repressor [Bradyrhizobium sp. WSM3983]|uniref:transcriptional repressor n=1 Tax=Bradyrhizobium sp. WSM3983 TaxID=1038867 RepID=UPI00040669F0|nr:transcriptional repressor [Bradyrhizobium sp. WSM3983]